MIRDPVVLLVVASVVTFVVFMLTAWLFSRFT